MNTDQKKKLAWAIGIILLLAVAFVVIYFKWVKPKADAKKEADRVAETKIIEEAQKSPAPPADLTIVQTTDGTPLYSPTRTEEVVDGMIQKDQQKVAALGGETLMMMA